MLPNEAHNVAMITLRLVKMMDDLETQDRIVNGLKRYKMARVLGWMRWMFCSTSSFGCFDSYCCLMMTSF